MKKSLILFFGALVAGIAVGWNRVEEPAHTLPQTARKTSPSTNSSRPVWTADDFIKLTRERRELCSQQDYNPLAKKLADWTDDEIIAALNASLTDPDIVLMAGGANGLDGDLLGEWMRRDLDAALAWFEQLGSLSAKGRMALKLGQYWPRDQTDRGLEFVRDNFELFPGHDSYPIVQKAFENAGEAGPAAVEKLLKVLRESGITLPLDPWDFSRDFDFATLSRSPEIQAIWGTGAAVMFMEQWLRQNRDSAFDWIVETHGAKSITMLFRHLVLENEDWLAGKFEKLGTAQRAEFVREMNENQMWRPGIIPFIQSIRDPSAQQDACKLGTALMFQGGMDDFMRRVEQLENPSLRISLLENAPSVDMDAEGEARLRQKLADWKASPRQIESILSRFKP